MVCAPLLGWRHVAVTDRRTSVDFAHIIRTLVGEQFPAADKIVLVLDNLSGHKTPAFVLWLFANGIMPLYTPLSGSWLNMCESVQRIIKRRALECQHPQSTGEIIGLLEATITGWNRKPAAFEGGGERARGGNESGVKGGIKNGAEASWYQVLESRTT